MWKAIIGIVIGIALCLTTYAARDITARRPTGEVIFLLGADASEQGYVFCPACGLAMYVHIQFSNTINDPIIVVTYWHDHFETRKRRTMLGILQDDQWIMPRGDKNW